MTHRTLKTHTRGDSAAEMEATARLEAGDFFGIEPGQLHVGSYEAEVSGLADQPKYWAWIPVHDREPEQHHEWPSTIPCGTHQSTAGLTALEESR